LKNQIQEASEKEDEQIETKEEELNHLVSDF